jgi:hypothetical protein
VPDPALPTENRISTRPLGRFRAALNPQAECSFVLGLYLLCTQAPTANMMGKNDSTSPIAATTFNLSLITSDCHIVAVAASVPSASNRDTQTIDAVLATQAGLRMSNNAMIRTFQFQLTHHNQLALARSKLGRLGDFGSEAALF